MMRRRRGLFFLGGFLLVCGAAGLALHREIEAAWYVRKLNTSKDWHARANAAIALGRLRVRRSASDLVRRLKDPALEVRRNCTWALAEVTGQPWGIQDGPAAEWWEKHGKEFLAGKTVEGAPRVRLPEASGGGRYLDAVVTLAEERVYHLGEDGDTIHANVVVKNRTDKPVTVLHPAWEEYEAYEYRADGTKTQVEVRSAPASSVVLTTSRASRSRLGVVESSIEEFRVLDDTIPAGGMVVAPFEITVTRQRPGVLFETYKLEARLNDVVLQTEEGMLTERLTAPVVTTYAWISGKEVFEQLGEIAEEASRSGRKIEGVAWARITESPKYSEFPHRPATGTPALFPVGAIVFVHGLQGPYQDAGPGDILVKGSEGASLTDPELIIGDAKIPGASQREDWVIVTRE